MWLVRLAVAILGLGSLVWSAIPAGFDGHRNVYVSALTPLEEQGFKTISLSEHRDALDVFRDPSGVVTGFILRQQGEHTLCLSRGSTACDAESTKIKIRGIAERWPACLALAGSIMLAYALLLFLKGAKPWYWLFSETGPKGGLSLSTLQLALWFFPAVGILGAVSIPLHRFPQMNAGFVVLLGLALATKALGGAASTPVTDAKDSETLLRPALTDLVSDSQGNPQFSRYQQLVVSAMGAAVLVVAFFDTLSIPEVPKEFLYLIAASQAGYVLPKAITTKGGT